MTAHVPLVDLAWQHSQIADDLIPQLLRLMAEGTFILSDDVQRFEAEYAAFAGVNYCTGVANGTDAIEMALRAGGIGPGDEVLVPANTFIATALAAIRAGARPVLVDCLPDTYLMDVDKARACVTGQTRAIVPVHLFGQMADMTSVAHLADEFGLVVIEDAAQAQGATQAGFPPGKHSLAAATSFYPGKNLGAYGDAGAVLTNNASTNALLRALRNYGSQTKYEHPIQGFNSRLDSIQAVVLSLKLKHLSEWNELRVSAASRYHELLQGSSLRLPTVAPGNTHVYHIYATETERRDIVLSALQESGVGAGIHYPLPLHLEGALSGLGYKRGDFPVAERVASRLLSLPIFPGITSEQQALVAHELRRALS